MFQNNYTPSSSILPMLDRHRQLWPKTAHDRPLTVKMETLDQIAQRNGIDGPSILKLDVQGFELNVLKGAEKTLTNCVLVQLEVLFEPLYESQSDFLGIMQFLSSHGLQFVDFVEQRRMKPNNSLVYADAAFMRTI